MAQGFKREPREGEREGERVQHHGLRAKAYRLAYRALLRAACTIFSPPRCRK